MGMGAIPCHGVITTVEKLREFLPNEMGQLEKIVSIDDLGSMLNASEDISKSINDAFSKLQEQFEIQTGGLTLELGCYDPDLGDCYDDLKKGVTFFVGGTHQITRAGILYQDLWENASWTVFG